MPHFLIRPLLPDGYRPRWLVLFLVCLSGGLLFLWLMTPMGRAQAQTAALEIESDPPIVVLGTNHTLTVTIYYTIPADVPVTTPYTLYYFVPDEQNGLMLSQTDPGDLSTGNGLHPLTNQPVRFWDIIPGIQPTRLFTVHLNVLEFATTGVFTHITELVNAAAPNTVIVSATATTVLTTAVPIPNGLPTLATPTVSLTPTIPITLVTPVPPPSTIPPSPILTPSPPIPPSTWTPQPTVTPTLAPEIVASPTITIPQVIATLPSPPSPYPADLFNKSGLFLILLLFMGLLVVVGLGGILFLWSRNRRKPTPRPIIPKSSLPTIALPAAASPSALPEAYLTDVTGKPLAITTPTFTIGRATDNQLVIDARFPEWETLPIPCHHQSLPQRLYHRRPGFTEWPACARPSDPQKFAPKWVYYPFR